MCNIFACFGWALDYIQRAITFFLACLLSCVVTIGFLVAIAAGVAYGYNYSMAEFLTFTRQDVTVYMRRGQFYDKPDVDMDQSRDIFSRRSNEDEDLFGMNKTIDYEDPNVKPKAKALLDSWGQVKDSRKYADVLIKYSKKKNEEESVHEPFKINSSPPSTASPIVTTILLQSGTSQIVMRKFQTVNIISYLETTTMQRNDNYFYQEPEELPHKSTEEPEPREMPTRTPTRSSILKLFGDQNRATHYVPLRHWDTTKKREVQDDVYAEDVDEDNLVYKMKSV